MFEDGLGDAEEEDNSYRLKRRFNKTARPSFLIDDETMEKDIDIEVPVIPRKISKILRCLLKWDLARMKLKYSEQPSKIFEDDDDYASQPKEDYQEESQYPMGYYDTDFPNDEQQELTDDFAESQAAAKPRVERNIEEKPVVRKNDQVLKYHGIYIFWHLQRNLYPVYMITR